MPTYSDLPNPQSVGGKIFFTLPGPGTGLLRRKASGSTLASDPVAFTILAPTSSTYVPRVATGPTITGPIPFAQPQQWYTLNNRQDRSPTQGGQEFTNGDLDGKAFFGYGTIFQGQNFESWYTFVELAEVLVTSVTLYGKTDTTGNVYLLGTDTGTKELVATYNQSGQPQTISFASPKPVKSVVVTANSFYGISEVVFQGSYRKTTAATLYPKASIKLKQMLGINSFVYDYEGTTDFKIQESRMQQMLTFGGYRDYIDWRRVEQSQGSISFDFVDGGWSYDNLFRRVKAEGRIMLPCIQKVPQWFQDLNGRPGDQYGEEVVPAPYGADWSDPQSYKLKARLGFYFAARYGRNPNVDLSLLTCTKVGKPYPDWVDGPSWQQLRGLDLVNYIEGENERDKWWMGRKSYQTGYEFAAFQSAFYDGDKGKLGPGYGVKAADPTMKVVFVGTADASTEYIRGAIDWCRQHRGYRADGSVDLCWDVASYHCYPFASGGQYQTTANRGGAPELTVQRMYAQQHVALGREYGYPVWMTETGYDVNQGSPLKAISIAGKDVEVVRADWALRTALLHIEEGIEFLAMYQTKDNNAGSATQFDSAGFLTDSGRKPQGDYVYQLNKQFGEYQYQETLSDSPKVQRYTNGTSTMYAVWMPTETGATGSYTLPGSAATVYTPQVGSDTMQATPLTGTLAITASETPIFVKIS